MDKAEKDKVEKDRAEKDKTEKDKVEKDKAEKKQKKQSAMTVVDLPGVGAATAEKLRESGFGDLMAISVATPGELMGATGLSEAAARKIIQVSRESLSMGFESGSDVLNRRKSIVRLTTGSRAFDELIGGGFETGAITETYGPYGSSKTQLAHALAVNVQLPKEKGGAEGQAVYIDTESSLPYDEKILVDKGKGMELVKIGELVESALLTTDKITKIGTTISTADNFLQIRAISYDPADYKVKRFPITGFIKHKPQQVYEAKLASGRKVRVTEYHNFFTLNDKCELDVIATKDLKKGLKIAVAGTLPLENTPKTIDLSETLRGNNLFVTGGKSFGNKLSEINKELKEIAKAERPSSDQAYNWITRKRLPLNIFNAVKKHLDNGLLKELQIGGWSRTNNIPLLLDIDEDFAWLMGLYSAEGSTTYINNTVIFSNQNKGIEKRVREIGAKLGLRFRRAKGDLKTTSKAFALLIKNLSFGNSADTKRVPDFVLQTDRERISSFLTGYVSGDGSADLITGTTTCETKSQALAQGIFYSTCALGIPARNNTITRTYKRTDSINISEEKDGQKYDMFSISWQTNPARDSRLEELPNDKSQLSNALQALVKQSGICIKAISDKTGIPETYLCNVLSGRGGINIRKSTVDKILSVLKSDSKEAQKLQKLIDGDIWFDEVKEINKLGIEPVYDIEVFPEKDVQNFIGGHGGVILHNTFRPERIIDMAKGAGLDPDKVLKNIKVARAYNSDHQMLLAEKVDELIKNENLNVKLVIVDSLTAHFRAEFIGRGTLAERQQKLNKHMHTLAKLADGHNLCVYVTNQVMNKPDMFFGDPTEAIGGHIVAHNSVFRIYLRRGKKGTRVAKLVDSPNLPENEVTFVVKEEGIRDV